MPSSRAKKKEVIIKVNSAFLSLGVTRCSYMLLMFMLDVWVAARRQECTGGVGGKQHKTLSANSFVNFDPSKLTEHCVCSHEQGCKMNETEKRNKKKKTLQGSHKRVCAAR